jgi:diguanylate cyclase (GGDEF)-like protein
VPDEQAEVAPSARHLTARDRQRVLLEALGVALLITLAAAAGTAGMWISYQRTQIDTYRSHLVEMARAAAVQIDPELHALIRRPEQIDSPEYRRAVAPLRRLRLSVPGIRYVYTLVRDGPYIRFILDSADPGINSNGIEDRSGVWEISNNKTVAIQIALSSNGLPGKPVATDEPYTDPWGTFMTGYAPFYDGSGKQAGAVGIDMDAGIYFARLAAARNRAVYGMAPAGILVVAFSLLFYRVRLRGLSALRGVAAGAAELSVAVRRDRLTGLPNRTVFMERLEQAIERAGRDCTHRFAVLFLDFDHFKLVNDTMGHEAGDELLRQIADRLRGALRAADTMGKDDGNIVARFGGDEFVVLINELNSEAEVQRIAERLLNTLVPHYTIGNREVHSTASIGIVTSDQRMESAEAVIRNADVAMYEAKRSGRACSVVFNEAMHVRLTRHVTIESALRKAIDTPQLYVVYQPIVELATGRMVSAEALLRWQHPDMGMISPAEFIPIAEESGLIVPLGGWVLQEACGALAHWRRCHPAQAPATVSVNISRAELALGARLLERIHEALAQAGLPAHCLQLEVTEREVMRDAAASHRLMCELQTLGVRLAMDDFGTGTSSLACLRDYPFDTIKVDRSFVSGLPEDQDMHAVIQATNLLVENLGMASVAEGVEHASQVAVLQSLGCRYAQGYFFSPPVSRDELPEALGRWLEAVSAA